MGVCIVNCDKGKVFGKAIRYDQASRRFLVEFHISKLKQWVSVDRVKVRLEDIEKIK